MRMPTVRVVHHGQPCYLQTLKVVINFLETSWSNPVQVCVRLSHAECGAALPVRARRLQRTADRRRSRQQTYQWRRPSRCLPQMSGMPLLQLGFSNNALVSAFRITPPIGRRSGAAPASRATRHHDAVCHVTPTSLRDDLRDFEQDASSEVPTSVTALSW
jgi:hypothetical protein